MFHADTKDQQSDLRLRLNVPRLTRLCGLNPESLLDSNMAIELCQDHNEGVNAFQINKSQPSDILKNKPRKFLKQSVACLLSRKFSCYRRCCRQALRF